MKKASTMSGYGLVVPFLMAVAALFLPGGSDWTQAKEAPGAKPVVSLKDAPVNTWVSISREKTGRRLLPIFLSSSILKTNGLICAITLFIVFLLKFLKFLF